MDNSINWLETFTFIISLLLVAFMIINVAATTFLARIARSAEPRLPALDERAWSAGIKTAGSLILGVLGFNRILDLHWSEPLVLVALTIAIILHSLPPVVWIWYYKRGKFNR